MSDEEIRFWKRVSQDLGIEVETPTEILLTDKTKVRAAALVRSFGAKMGMVVDADWSVIAPFAKRLLECGYGYSANIGASSEKYKCGDMIEILADWGWSGPADERPLWLPISSR